MRRLILLAIFVGLPILEIYVIIQVGQVIGAVPTVLLLIFESMLGAWLIKHEGRRAWNALQETLPTGQDAGQGAGRRRPGPGRRHAAADTRAS